MKCPACGAPVSRPGINCPDCGTFIPDPYQITFQEIFNPRNYLAEKEFVAIVVFLGLLILFFFF